MVRAKRQRLDARNDRMERHKPMTHDALKLARAALDDDSEGDSDLSPLCRSIVGEHRDVRSRDDRSERVDEIAEIKSRLSKLEAAAKRKPSRNKKMTQSDMETLASAIGNCLGQELQAAQPKVIDGRGSNLLRRIRHWESKSIT